MTVEVSVNGDVTMALQPSGDTQQLATFGGKIEGKLISGELVFYEADIPETPCKYPEYKLPATAELADNGYTIEMKYKKPKYAYEFEPESWFDDATCTSVTKTDQEAEELSTLNKPHKEKVKDTLAWITATTPLSLQITAAEKK